MDRYVLIFFIIEPLIIIGSVWFGHWITMRAFSYQHPMTGNMTTTASGEPSVMFYDPAEDEEEEPDATLQAHRSMEALEKMGIGPEDYLGPEGPPGYVKMGENEPHIPEEKENA